MMMHLEGHWKWQVNILLSEMAGKQIADEQLKIAGDQVSLVHSSIKYPLIGNDPNHIDLGTYA